MHPLEISFFFLISLLIIPLLCVSLLDRSAVVSILFNSPFTLELDIPRCFPEELSKIDHLHKCRKAKVKSEVKSKGK